MSTSKHSLDLIQLLKPLSKEEAGGLFSQTYLAMNAFSSFGADSTATDESRLSVVMDFTLIASYIASAKKSLTPEVRETLISIQYAWIAGLATREQIAAMVDKGIYMTQEEFDYYFKKERKALGDTINKAALYVALCASGIDGLNTEEIIRFLRVGRHMDISEKELNDLLVLYFHECSLIKAFHKNIVGQSKL